MKRDKFIEQMKKEGQIIRDRERLIALARKHYARFGEKVVNIMMYCLASESGMNQLMKILEIPGRISVRDEDQHAAVINWISTYGERRFLELHKKGYYKKIDSFKIQPIITDDIKKPLYGAPQEIKVEAPPKPSTPSPEPAPASPEPAPAPKEASPAPPETRTEPGKWDGVERRSGKDRRKTPDRRGKVETIFFANRRFGGSRRNGKERRKNGNTTVED